jgi:hypothetical protein
LHDRWNGSDAREQHSDPDSASAALRIGHLRRCTSPDYANSVGQEVKH